MREEPHPSPVRRGPLLFNIFAEVDAAGVIPVSLIRWQLTGKDDEIRALLQEP